MDQFIILLLGSFAVTLCVIFAMEPRSRKISLPAGIGILATVIGAVVGTYYTVKQLERWDTEDRPRVVASSLSLTGLTGPAEIGRHWGLIQPATYRFTFSNTGIQEAKNIKIKIVATDLLHTHTTMLLKQAAYEIPRLAHGINQPVTTDVENDQDFIVVCIEYSNDGGAPFTDPPTLYATPLVTLPSPNEPNHQVTLRSSPHPVVTALDYDKVLKGLSCAKL